MIQETGKEKLHYFVMQRELDLSLSCNKAQSIMWKYMIPIFGEVIF
jgi:hypothetical protein